MKKGLGMEGPTPFSSNELVDLQTPGVTGLALQVRGSAARTATSDLLLFQAVHIRLEATEPPVESADRLVGLVRTGLRSLGSAQGLRGRLLGLARRLLRTLSGAKRRVRGGLGVLDFFLGGAPAKRHERCGAGSQGQDVQMLVHDDAPLLCDRNIFRPKRMRGPGICLN